MVSCRPVTAANTSRWPAGVFGQVGDHGHGDGTEQVLQRLAASGLAVDGEPVRPDGLAGPVQPQECEVSPQVAAVRVDSVSQEIGDVSHVHVHERRLASGGPA